MIRWLRSLFAPELAALRADVDALRRSEAERERVVNEQLEQLAKYWKRIRTRAAREADLEAEEPDALALARRMKLTGGSRGT